MSGGGGTGLIVMPDRSDEVMIVLTPRFPCRITHVPYSHADIPFKSFPHRTAILISVRCMTSHRCSPARVAPRTRPHRPCWHAPAAAVPLLHVLCRRVTRSPFRLLPCSQALPDCDRQTIQMMNRRKPENVPTSVALRARVSRAQPPAPTVTRV